MLNKNNNNNKDKYIIQEDRDSPNDVTEALKSSSEIELGGFDNLDNVAPRSYGATKGTRRTWIKFALPVVGALVVLGMFVGVGYSICCTGKNNKQMDTVTTQPSSSTIARVTSPRDPYVSLASFEPSIATSTITQPVNDTEVTHIQFTSPSVDKMTMQEGTSQVDLLTATSKSITTIQETLSHSMSDNQTITVPLPQEQTTSQFVTDQKTKLTTYVSSTDTDTSSTYSYSVSSLSTNYNMTPSIKQTTKEPQFVTTEFPSEQPYTSSPYNTMTSSSTGDDIITEIPVTLQSTTLTPRDDWPITYGINLESTTLHPSGSFRFGQASDTHSCHSVRVVPQALRDATVFYPEGIPAFYQKYTEVYGIPIVGSHNVTDAGLRRACYVVRYLLASRYDIRNAIYKFYGRVALIGDNEQQTDLWEYRNLDSEYWNNRARGLGPKLKTPLTSVGDDNQRCHKQDRYPKEDILIHEFGHAIHILGAQWVIPGFQRRLTNLYTSAMDQGKFKDQYMAETVKEYFAQGSEIYLGLFNVTTKTADGTDVVLHDRHTLRQYDQGLADLLQEVFPCDNHFVDRCDWRNESRCNMSNFKKLYDESEGLTSKCTVVDTYIRLTAEECALRACTANVPVFLHTGIVCRTMACSSTTTEDLMLSKTGFYNIYVIDKPVVMDTLIENSQAIQELCTRSVEIPGMCDVPDTERVQCGPVHQTEALCHTRGCCYHNHSCFYSKLTAECLDQKTWCPARAARGECVTDPDRMAVCKLSCGMCGPGTMSTAEVQVTTVTFTTEESTVTTVEPTDNTWPITMGANIDAINHPSGNMRPGEATDTHSCYSVRDLPQELRNKTVMYPEGINQFYQKYTETYGIPIIGSENVTDEGLMRACYTIKYMLSHRYDIRNAVYKFYGRIGMIADDEEQTSLWEYRNRDPVYWNNRVRGLGPTIYIPMASVGDDNQRCSHLDNRYPSFDILVHEFAHFVDQLAARYVVPGFARGLQRSYEQAIKEGKYNKSYMGSNMNEYWAVATEIFFETYKAGNLVYEINGTNMALRDRNTLRMYDPDLVDLLEEVYPCPHSFIHKCAYKRPPNCDLSNYKLLYPKTYKISPNCGYVSTYRNIATVEECAAKACNKLISIFTYSNESMSCKLSKCEPDKMKIKISNTNDVDLFSIVTVAKAGQIEANSTIEQLCARPVDSPNLCEVRADKRKPCGPREQTNSQCSRRGCCMIDGLCVHSKSAVCTEINWHCPNFALRGDCDIDKLKPYMYKNCPNGCDRGVCQSILSGG